MPRLSETHMPALDGLRGLAVLMVMVYHFTVLSSLSSPEITVLLAVTRGGWAGVDLFFVLSGFLITGILHDAKGTAHYFRNFYMRRVLRIFPLYYGVLALCLLVLPRILPMGPAGADDILRNQAWFWLYASNVFMTLTRTWGLTSEWFWMNHLWSLGVEEHFYLVWPLLVFALRRRSMMLVCGIAAFAALGFRLYYLLDGNWTAAYVFSPCRMDSLAIGGLVALAARGPGGLPALARKAPFIAVGAALGLAPIIAYRWGLRYTFMDPVVDLFGFPLLAAFFAALLALAVARPEDSLLQRAFRARWLTLLGQYSYGAYVFHGLLQPICLRYFPDQQLLRLVRVPLLAVVLHALLGIALSVGLAVLSWHLYERRFLSLRRYFYAHSPAVG